MVYVNGTQYSSSQVRLDGSTASFPVLAEADSEITVDVLLSGFNARHSFKFVVDKDKEALVDFSDYSQNSAADSNADQTAGQ